MKQIFSYFIIVFILAGIVSCDRKRVFESYYELDKKGWNKDSVVVFNVQLTDTIKNHNLYVNIRNKGSYAYSNLWLFLTVNSPDGKMRTDHEKFP